ncbi:uncharacterized protein KD926_007334 [Aspergillus affinis]|uniref:uncharacterized protein n=1 Tax=Aspergillus affinis TaxID=1070780 RepID=UPI0022FDD950|nr:uncharacterized protein KD926_007334 [Aspergillus affinis]KAI9041065.1 hypothetical protein KD926_007334 [Aspergillus affinis]
MGPGPKAHLLICLLLIVGMTMFHNKPEKHTDDKLQTVKQRRIQRCNKFHPCKNGCCSKSGLCGVGPDYCGIENCVDCREKEPPRCSRSKISRLAGYYELWNDIRPCNKFMPHQIHFATYAHVNIAFATINPHTFELNPIFWHHAMEIEQLTERKKYDPDLRVSVTISGLSGNDWGLHDSSVFSRLAASEEYQAVFLRSLTSFMSTYDIDGVDINWEHPDGQSDDYENLPRLIKNIKAALMMTGGRYGLTMTLPTSLSALHNYNLRKLNRQVDYFNLMPIDLHTQLSPGDTWQADTLGPVVNLTAVSQAVDLLWRNYIHPNDVNLVLTLYGASLIPKSLDCLSPGCLAISGALGGFSSKKTGMLMNSEIQDMIDPERHELMYGRLRHKHNWGNLETKFDPEIGAQIGMNGERWIAYDDKESLEHKMEFARSWCFGGITAWAITHDTWDADYSKVLDCLVQGYGRWKSLQLFYCDEIAI